MLRSIILAAALVAAGQAAAQEAKPAVELPRLIKAEGPYSPEGKVELVPAAVREHELHKIESGTVNGVPYRFYYTDGSGSFAGVEGNTLNVRERLGTNWSVACKQDPITDKKFCYISRGALWIWLYPGRTKVHVAGSSEGYPGTAAVVRVDGNPPVSTAADGEGVFGPKGSQAIIAQLKKGAKVTTRYVDWPYRSAEDDSFPLYGFNEVYAYAQWALRNM